MLSYIVKSSQIYLSPMATVVGEKEVDISQLSIEQLNQMKGSLEQEIQVLAQNYGALKEAQSRFADSKRTVSGK